MPTLDNQLRSIVRKSIDAKQQGKDQRTDGLPVLRLAELAGLILVFAFSVAVLSEIYASIRMADYLEFHRMMAERGG